MKRMMILAASAILIQGLYAKGYELLDAKKQTFYIGQEVTTDNNIHFKCTASGGNVTIAYEKIEVNVPAEWEYSFCDNVGCYFAFPENGEYAPLAYNEEAYMKVTLNAKGKAGVARVRYVIYDKNDPTEKDTLDYTIINEWNLGTAKTGVSVLKVMPNPCVDQIAIEGLSQAAQWQIMATDGRVLLSGTLNEGEKMISVQAIPTGVYLLSIGDAMHKRTARIVKQ